MGVQESDTIRLLIVDDQELIRTGLSILINDMPGIEVAATASGYDDALRLAAAHQDIQVALVDARMPGRDGIELIRRLGEIYPRMRRILLTAFDEDDNLVGALRAGAVGYLLKDVSSSDLESAIRTAASGGQVIGTSAVGHAMRIIAENKKTQNLASRSSKDDGDLRSAGQQMLTDVQEAGFNPLDKLAGLTERERQITKLVAQGRTNTEIARELFLSTGTVKNHVSHIFQTLCVRNRTELTALLNGTLI